MLPLDPIVLLSVVNTRLRDSYADLQDLCAAEDVKEQNIIEILASVGFRYDPETNQFI